MDIGMCKEQFSFAYIRAVASAAGYFATKLEVDEDSIDLLLSGRSSGGISCRPRIEIQVKCTATDDFQGENLVFSLKKKNYDELRITNCAVPRLLVVVLVPENADDWLGHSEEEMKFRKCGYWVSLRERPENNNTSTVNVRIPRSNLFNVAGLRELMRKSAQKEPL